MRLNSWPLHYFVRLNQRKRWNICNCECWDKIGLLLQLDLMENFFSKNIEAKLGEPVVCSTQCLCEHESKKGEATCNAKYKVTIVWQQAVTAQCLFCEFTAPIPSQPLLRSEIPSWKWFTWPRRANCMKDRVFPSIFCWEQKCEDGKLFLVQTVFTVSGVFLEDPTESVTHLWVKNLRTATRWIYVVLKLRCLLPFRG